MPLPTFEAFFDVENGHITPLALDADLVKQLPICSICFEEYDNIRELIQVLVATCEKHAVFCADCLKEASRQKKECPVCRTPLIRDPSIAAPVPLQIRLGPPPDWSADWSDWSDEMGIHDEDSAEDDSESDEDDSEDGREHSEDGEEDSDDGEEYSEDGENDDRWPEDEEYLVPPVLAAPNRNPAEL